MSNDRQLTSGGAISVSNEGNLLSVLARSLTHLPEVPFDGPLRQYGGAPGPSSETLNNINAASASDEFIPRALRYLLHAFDVASQDRWFSYLQWLIISGFDEKDYIKKILRTPLGWGGYIRFSEDGGARYSPMLPPEWDKFEVVDSPVPPGNFRISLIDMLAGLLDLFGEHCKLNSSIQNLLQQYEKRTSEYLPKDDDVIEAITYATEVQDNRGEVPEDNGGKAVTGRMLARSTPIWQMCYDSVQSQYREFFISAQSAAGMFIYRRVWFEFCHLFVLIAESSAFSDRYD
jgi:hypothetical protein